MNERVRMLGIGLMCIGLMSCTRGDPQLHLNANMPVTVPFELDKAGNKASIDFWAKPGDVDFAKAYMVIFSFSQKGSRDPMPELVGDNPHIKIPLKVTVSLIRDQADEPIATLDHAEFLSAADSEKFPLPSWERPNSNIAYLFLGRSDGDTADMWVVSFRLKEYGHYRVDVEALQDQPIFTGIKSELAVQERFSLGE